MLFAIVPLNALASSYTGFGGQTFTGATGFPPTGGFDIVDSFNAPTTNTIPIDTAYGGGYGTGTTGGGSVFDGSTTQDKYEALPQGGYWKAK